MRGEHENLSTNDKREQWSRDPQNILDTFNTTLTDNFMRLETSRDYKKLPSSFIMIAPRYSSQNHTSEQAINIKNKKPSNKPFNND